MNANLLVNPSFANGTTGWITYFQPGAGSFATDSTGHDASGSGKVAIPSTYTTNQESYAQVYQTVAAEGGTYTMSFFFQKTEGTSKKITAFCSDDGGTHTLFGTTACTNTSGWTSCSVSCSPPAGKTVRFGVSAAGDNVDVRLDDFTLTSSTSGSCSFSVSQNSYDGPSWWGTVAFTNQGPSSASSYKVEFDVPAGAHCTNDAVPSGAVLSPLTGTGTSAHTSSNHCVFTWTNATALAAGASKTFNYSTDTSASFDAKASTEVHDAACNP
jgi:hypothetical protein